eukprot:7722573-Pyramimonas_sp.AAC.1
MERVAFLIDCILEDLSSPHFELRVQGLAHLGQDRLNFNLRHEVVFLGDRSPLGCGCDIDARS